MRASGSGRSSTLRLRIVTVFLLVSLLPLCLMGGGAWVVFGRLLDAKALELQRAVVQSHAASIEAYLATQRELLEVLARTNRRDELVAFGRLRFVLDQVNRVSGGSLVDLGVVAADGTHLAYAGPYDLVGRNYHEAEWFREVMVAGVFTSDVFLGIREVPHFVIAVKQNAPEGPWVLRATISSDRFETLVASGPLGASAEAFLVNRDWLYQTTPRVGRVLDRATVEPVETHTGLCDQRVTVDGVEKIRVTTWVNDNRWLLVVQQDSAEVRAPVTRAIATGALLTSLAVLLVVFTTLLATRHLQRQVDRANRQREELFRAFMRSAKLASVSELATGLAHEVNNPLGIISAEQTNLADLVELARITGETRQEMTESLARIRAQIQRCASITKRMLQFGRQHESAPEPTELVPRLGEIVALMNRQATVRNVTIRCEVEDQLPPVLADPVELEQVLVNLITNSFHAMPQGGTIVVAARRADDRVAVEVRDSGQGMPPEVRERVFEPFFTTKPVGKGTGLGLAVCHGIVTSWGGTIEVESAPGRGTTVRLGLPVAQE